MNTAKKIVRRLRQLPEGTTFGYRDLSIEPREYLSAAKAIERLIAKGTVKRASSGVFYKPQRTVFGEVKPREEELLKPYLFREGKRRAYVTGAALFHRMGLTTQVPATIKIASQGKRIYTSVGSTKGKPVKSYVDVTDKNYPLLELLDALKDFKKISDLDKKAAITLLISRLSSLTSKEQQRLLTYALAYPPRVKALLGAMLETLPAPPELGALRRSLNPLSSYAYGLSKEWLPTMHNWNLK